MKSKEVKVKIQKSKGMSQIEAEALVVKALTADTHKETFNDEANQHAADVVSMAHEKILDDLMDEIFGELENEEL